MKTLVTLAATLLISLNIFAQISQSEQITITASLNTTMALDVTNEPISFEFSTLDDYEDGLGGKFSTYSTNASISSTSNWEFGYKASGQLTHSDGSTTMPLDNIGVTIDWTGTNSAKNYCKNTPLALDDENILLIGQQGNQSNAGDNEANSFVIYWEMGTTDGNMNDESLFEQDLKKGLYNVNVEFIITEVID